VDDVSLSRARSARGTVTAEELGPMAGRRARSAGLVLLQPRVYVARTQPVDGPTLVEAVRRSVRCPYAFLGEVALWRHGVAPAPRPGQVVVGVPLTAELALMPPVRVRRVSENTLSRVRTRGACPVVDLEVAVLQVCARQSVAAARDRLEPLLRERRTTAVRLRERCGRGLEGSAVVRCALDELAGGSLDAAVRLLRRALEHRGVPDLACEVRFESRAGARCYGDLWAAGARTLVEVDGFLTHAVRERFRADRRRDRWVAAEHDVRTLRVDAQEVWDDVDALADELAPLLLPLDQPGGAAA
jgi:hypothetical protein